MRLRFQLPVFTAIRTVLNTAHRMVYPFLPIFARALNVDLSTMSLLMTARSLLGATSPLFAPLADRKGRRFGLLTGLGIFTLGAGLVAVYPAFWTLATALILAMIGKYIFDPSMQAHFGDRIPYEKRGMALAVTEVAWSMGFIVGVPVAAYLISKYGWHSPYLLFTLFGAISMAVIPLVIPREDRQHKPASNPRDQYRAALRSLPAMAGISIAFFASAGNEMVNLVFGVWLEDSFGLKLAALAGASAIIGISELSGEGLVAFTVDRLGKPLALTIGLAGNAIASLLLPVIGHTPTGALIGLFFFYITFEYVMVSHIPLVTELVPSARATLLSLNVTGHSVGRALGALLGTFIYQNFGFAFVCFSAILFNFAGVFALFAMQMRKGRVN